MVCNVYIHYTVAASAWANLNGLYNTVYVYLSEAVQWYMQLQVQHCII